MKANAFCCLLSAIPKRFGLGRSISEKRNVRNSFCGVSSSFCLFSCKAIFFYSIYRRFKPVVSADYKEIWCQCISFQNSSYNVKEVCVSIWRANLTFYYMASLRPLLFLWGGGDHKLVVFATSSLFVWNQMPWRKLIFRFFTGTSSMNRRILESVTYWIDFSENLSDFS